MLKSLGLTGVDKSRVSRICKEKATDAADLLEEPVPLRLAPIY